MVAVVFGARGNVGRYVAQGLRASGQQVRVTSRNPAEAGFASGLQVAAADLERPETLPAALAGAELVFLYAKPDGVDGFVQAAISAGVRHVALLSSAAVVHPGAEHNPIAVLAVLAVTALAEPGHGGQAYTVYGPQSLTLRRQVEDIGDAAGRKITFEVPSDEQARRELGQSMFPAGSEAILRAWAAGTPAQTSTVVPTVTGHRAHTLAQWAADHVAEFRSLRLRPRGPGT